MTRPGLTGFLPFLSLLFVGTLCNAMMIPFMGFFLVEGLGREPWTISVYTAMAIALTVTVNRRFAGRIDSGARAFPLIGIAIGGYVFATLSLSLSPSFWVVLSCAVLGFGTASSAVSSMFSLGGAMAEGRGMPRARFNAYMRATTSTGWMVGPALAFLVADLAGPASVFKLGAGVAMLWALLWWRVLPRDLTAAKPAPGPDDATTPPPTGLWLAAAFVFCLAAAHSLSFTALPLFYVQEVGLPGYAPGAAFSIKTFVEVFAILSTPAIIVRVGLWPALMGTTLLAVGAIQVLAAVSSFPTMMLGAALEGLYYGFFASLGISFLQSKAPQTPARATALYWNTLMISGLLAGPAVGLIAQFADFRLVLDVATGVAALAVLVLLLNRNGSRAF